MSEEQADYISEANDMLGKGYEQPAAIIDPPRTVTALRENGLSDYKVWGWVKTSAKFRSHIKILRGAKHDIWHYLALGVDENGTCKETIKQICEGTGYSHTEVINTLRELDEMGYLSVTKNSKGNIYTPEFVARGENKPTESAVKKVESTPAYQVESTPPIEKSPSIPLRVKRVNTPKGDLVDLELSKLPAISIRKAITEHFRLNVNWETKTSRQFLEWAHGEGITAEQVKTAADVWRMDKAFNWQVPTLKGIFEKWQMLMDAAPNVKSTPTEYRPKIGV